MSDDRFLERLRGDARQLQFEPDEVAMRRVSARIRASIDRPSVFDLITHWIRPIAASVAAIALAAVIALGAMSRTDSLRYDEPPEISMAGDSYSVE